MQMIRFALLIPLLALAACQPNAGASAQGPAETPAQSSLTGTSSAATQQGPFYSGRDGDNYLYVSTDDGILPVAYMGHKNNYYQLIDASIDASPVVYECRNPCQIVKTFQLTRGGDVVQYNYQMVKPESLAALMFKDVADGRLEQWTAEHEGVVEFLWVENNGAQWYPVESTAGK